ncbi:MAG: NAD(+) diphosphatase [Bacteroidaceae bacterium]|nr:NAD(+) diphosphatase [Bacteroidaceae bacterium]
MTRYLAYCKGDILLTCEGSIPFGFEPPVPLKPWNQVTTLEVEGDDVKLIRLDQPVTGIDGLQMAGLRKTHAILSAEDYQLAGKGAELLYWDQNTRYCGACGAPTEWMTSISKKCPVCGKEWWPSVSTAIIVRILRADCILLVRARSFRGNRHGLVAGFLETGETLEQCVEREVREETGIQIKNLRYFASQPWPYPFGLMVGFTADYAGGELRLQKSELCEGGWFSRSNLPPIPDKASIARALIDDWINSDVSGGGSHTPSN